MSRKQVRSESSNSVQNLREKQEEDTEISPLNDVLHHRFILTTGTMITDNNKPKSKYRKEVQINFSVNQVTK